jgi:putative hydrolase
LKLIAAPIAHRSSEDAVANFRNLMPGQPDEFYRTVSEKMSGVAAHLYGVQLGQLLGVLAEGVLIGSEFSLIAGQPPVLIAENCQEFAGSISVDAKDVYIYLASRELLTASLLDANPWLRESLVTQVARYASQIAFNGEGLQELQNAIQESDFVSLNDLMGTLVNVRPSPEQAESLASLQHLLTLTTGWVDHVTLVACRHLTGLAAIDEAYRRRRVTSSPMSKVFKLLLNTDVDPARVRSAASFWATVSEKLDAPERDRLWNHPDLLPTPAEVANPKLLLDRIDGQPEDDMDAALRKLLGESES